MGGCDGLVIVFAVEEESFSMGFIFKTWPKTLSL